MLHLMENIYRKWHN